ncbi:MAG: aminotransferase class I/II-fold pyridoxal phosphate-dependent enzyme [Gemmatimonadales bacterium]|nr:aminotransferase class I/II-fold pyridoxal phosphate-dependent enzyme [Gemmatimonadales bacterium]NIN13192.1 aminotransferase class I/II-fold pyridoxal phosphate-dependent enzyme [Gemmatimonadales bacterium]NIN51470.1 aminotransferase class I/II-fold pyridoxal phosphate-dependent enzyme [Gemmatimonadales bacterium]NIP08934.1 aminotransferase class I/II-fold pyridoxal phosphate-dependent enzyme [Gemmatimonadales bacterium]NIR03722.1 aminotransferase class I/II-fold pyridoxal phosphate-depende
MVERFKPIRFSRAGVRGLKVSATLAINDRVQDMWSAGQNVYHLAFGESRFPVHPKVAAALRAHVQKRSYLPALGIPELRRAIAEYHQTKFDLDVTPEQVVVGPGAKSLIFASLLALGEEVIIPQPSWVSYAPQAHLLAKPATFVPTRPEANFELELDVLETRMQESRQNWGNPEVFIVNSPKNPTGTMMHPEKVEALAGFARENELMVLSDEVYSLMTFGGVPHISIAHFYPEGTIVFGGLSKNLPLGGWRFGTAILPPGTGGRALAHAIGNIASNIWTCVTAPVQYAALVAYSGDPEVEEYIDLCARMHSIRTRFLFQTMVHLGIPCVEPAGAFYLFPSFQKWKEPLAARGVHTDDDLALHLLERYEIATLPGSAFHSAQELCLRISSSYIDAATDERADALLVAFREDPDPERFVQHHHPRLLKVAERFGEFIKDLERESGESGRRPDLAVI